MLVIEPRAVAPRRGPSPRVAIGARLAPYNGPVAPAQPAASMQQTPARAAQTLRAAGKFSTALDPSRLNAAQLQLLRLTQPEAPGTRRAAAYHGKPLPAPQPQPAEATPAVSSEPQPAGRRHDRSPGRSVPLHINPRDACSQPLPFAEQLVRALVQVPSTPPQLMSLMKRGDSVVMPGSLQQDEAAT